MTAGLARDPAPTVTDGVVSRRRWPVYAAAAVLVVGGVTAAVLLTGQPAPTSTGPVATLETAVAEQVDLVDYLELDGTLTYSTTVEFSAVVDGVVTGVAGEGELLDRGDTVFSLNERPVPLLFGEIPAYRALEGGASPGLDVRQLETNLASLGYGEGLVVDSAFDAATTAAVEAWQADLGVEETGTVGPGDYLVGAGPTRVQSVLVGWGGQARAGSPVVSGVGVAAEQVVVAVDDGALLELAPMGETLGTGDIAYETVGRRVPVIVASEPFVRELAEGDSGDDVALLEQALAALEYDADGDLEVDDEFDSATTAALIDWEHDLGIETDGILQVDQVVVVGAGMSVTAHLAGPGDELDGAVPVLELARSNRVVTFGIPVDDQSKVGVGESVLVELVDGSEVTASVTSVGAVATAPDPATDPVIEVTVAMDEIGLELVEAPVVVRVTDEISTGAIVVPASALLVLQEGGYAVEVVEGGARTLVAVELGEFSDGLVAVTGEGISAGVEVVVP